MPTIKFKTLKKLFVSVDSYYLSSFSKTPSEVSSSKSEPCRFSDEVLADILDHLSDDRCEEWEDWFNIAKVFINEDLNMNIFNEWSKKSSKYDKKTR